MSHTFATNDAPVAQLDRASASGAEGRGFESRRAYQLFQMRVEYVCKNNPYYCDVGTVTPGSA